MADFRIINHNGVNGNELLSLKIPSGNITKINSITVNEFLKLVKRPKTVEALTGLVIKKANAVIGTQPNLNFIEGTNVTLDIVNNTGTQSVDVTVNAAGGSGGGQVDSVVAGTGISVNSTDPVNPIVNLNSASIASLLLADSSVQSITAGTNITVDNSDPHNPIVSSIDTTGLESVVAGTNISIDNTDPDNPIINSTAVEGGESLNETLVIGNTTSGEDIVITSGDVIDFTGIGIVQNFMTFPASGRLWHISSGAINWDIVNEFNFLNTSNQGLFTINTSGSVEVGGSAIDGTLIIHRDNKSSNIFATSLTDARSFILPDADVDWTGGSTGYAMIQQVDGSFIPQAITSSVPLEEDIIGTATYNATMTGTVNLDFATFASFFGILTGNTTITVSNLPSLGESVTRSLKIKSTTTETLTMPTTNWHYVGTYVPDGSVYDFQIEATNFPTVGIYVTCYINKLT